MRQSYGPNSDREFVLWGGMLIPLLVTFISLVCAVLAPVPKTEQSLPNKNFPEGNFEDEDYVSSRCER